MKVRLSEKDKIKIANSEDVYRIMQAILMRQNKLHRQKEYFWSIGLNTVSDILYIELVTIGTLNKNSIDPVELFSFAVQKKCKRLILVHNHPSGSIKPSKSDISLTQSLKKGGEYLKIDIEDHIIITENQGFLSFSDEGLL
ncbi:MAG TPA: JAB domain-containing protein [Bacteroidia bacterium]|nr:JAB domain-containing protein [Bacteroidia bacterium]